MDQTPFPPAPRSALRSLLGPFASILITAGYFKTANHCRLAAELLEILIALTEHVGALTKDELIARAWSNATVGNRTSESRWPCSGKFLEILRPSRAISPPSLVAATAS